MRMTCCFLFIFLILLLTQPAKSQDKNYDPESNESGVMIVNISWRGTYFIGSFYEPKGAFSIDVKNTGKKSIKAVNWEFFLVDRVRGGRRNVKVADLPTDIKEKLGKRYTILGKDLTKVKRDAKVLASITREWQRMLLNKYSILDGHPDLLDQIDPYSVPSDADASEMALAPWQIAIEIAARETVPNYLPRSVSGETLKKNAILPNKEEE